MYCFIYVLWFVFLVVIIQMHHHWIIFKTFKNKILSSLSSKASEPLINSTYSFFLAIFTIYVMHEIMNYRLFPFSYMYPRCWFLYG
jgi:uncharacterized membrane protein